MSACWTRQPRRSRSARMMRTPRIRYSVKCASFRIAACAVSSERGFAWGKSHASTGRITDPVCAPVNQLVDAKKMTPAQATTGAHRVATPPSGDKLGDRLVHERERVLVELRVDEALDLVALRGVALAAGTLGELRAGEEIEELEHRGIS